MFYAGEDLSIPPKQIAPAADATQRLGKGETVEVTIAQDAEVVLRDLKANVQLIVPFTLK